MQLQERLPKGETSQSTLPLWSGDTAEVGTHASGSRGPRPRAWRHMQILLRGFDCGVERKDLGPGRRLRHNGCFVGVAVTEFQLGSHNSETLLFGIILNSNPIAAGSRDVSVWVCSPAFRIPGVGVKTRGGRECEPSGVLPG